MMYIKEQRLTLLNRPYNQVRKDVEVPVAPMEEVVLSKCVEDIDRDLVVNRKDKQGQI